MPFVDEDTTQATIGGGGQPQSEAAANAELQTPVARENRMFPTLPDDDIRNVFGASMSSGNVIGDAISQSNYLSQLSGVDHTLDPTFDPVAAVKKYPGYEQYDVLGQSRNQQEFDVTIAKIKQELANKATMSNASTLQSIAAGAFDPIYYIPLVGQEAMGAGILGHAIKGAAHMAAASTVNAGVNYATNITSTAKEEALNVAGQTVFGGVLGGAAGAVSHAIDNGGVEYLGKKLNSMKEVADSNADASAKYADNLRAASSGEPFDPNKLANVPANENLDTNVIQERPQDSSVGAMSARPTTTLDQESLVPANIVPNKLAAVLPDAVSDKLDLTKSLSFNDPLMSLMNSPSIEARRAIQMLADIPADIVKNREGVASAVPAESLIKQWEGELARTNLETHNLYSQYRFGRAAKTGDSLRTAPDLFRKPTDGKLTFRDFSNAIGDAMTRGDKHEIPEVQQAAQMYRSRIFDPLKDQAIKAGRLPVDVKPETAASYLTRLYNREKIIHNRPAFERTLTSWLKSTNTNISDRFDHYSKQAAQAEKIADEYKAKKEDVQRAISEHVPLNRESIKQFNILQREMQVLDRQHQKAFDRAQKAKERVTQLTPAQADAEFKKAIGHVKNGIPKNQRASTLSEWIRKNGGLKDDGGEVRALGGAEKGLKLINNKSGMALDEAALRAKEAGYFPDAEDRPDIKTFLEGLSNDASGRVPMYSDSEIGMKEYEDYIHQLGAELDKNGIDVNKLSAGQVENLLREGFPGAPDHVAQRAKMREAEYAQRRAEEAHQNIAAEVKRRQLRFDDLRVQKEGVSAKLKSARAELEDIKQIISNNNEKASRWRALAEDVHYIARADDSELSTLATEITDGLIGQQPGRLSYKGVPVTRGPLKERTLLIPDEMIKDYLDRDIFRVARHYQHTMSSDLSIGSRFGTPDMKSAFDRINDNYAQLRSDAAAKHGISSLRLEDGEFKANTDDINIPPELAKELKALDVEQRRDVKNLEGVRDRMRGTYGAPSNPYAMSMRTYRVVKQLNYMRSLGMQALTAISHAAKPVAVHGVMRIIGDGMVPMIKNMKQFRLAADEAKLANTGLEMASNATQMALANLDDNWNLTSKFERGVAGLSDNFRFVTLMSPFIAAMKQFTGVVSQTRSLEAIEKVAKGGDVSASEIARLAKYGINEDWAKRIFAEVDQHGTKQDDVWWANTAAWQDKTAAELYRTALQREVDRIIVTPGQDVPLFMSRPMGAMLLQFRSFAVASIQRTLVSGLQQRDMAVLNGFMLATALGMFSYWAKTPTDKLSDDPKAWIGEGIDRAGAFGWFDDANNTLEKITGNTFGLRPALGMVPKKNQHYEPDQAAQALLGPTYSTVLDTFLPIMNDVANGNMNQDDVHKMRQMLPYQNLFYMRKIFDAGESGVNNSFGVPKKHRYQ